MTNAKLPTKLAKEPLIDVVFEVRFSSRAPASTFLPGVLFSKLGKIENIESLPASQLPQPLRDADPQLKYAPVTRLVWGQFAILVGDRVLAIGCKMPYPGWTKFREAILQVIGVLGDLELVTSIERYAIKYVDFFDTGNDYAKAVKQFDMGLRIGKHTLAAENASIRMELPRKPLVHAIQIMLAAAIEGPNMPKRSGAILDVDSSCAENLSGVREFVDGLAERIDQIHMANKEVFFECLSADGLRDLGPQYA